MIPDTLLLENFEAHHRVLREAREEISHVVIGQKSVIDLTLITLLSNGHGLFVGMPGLAKTLLVSTVGDIFGFDTKRIQCTPDLMPGDILGSEILEQSSDGTRQFKLIKGPIFSQLLMVDEINRASPRTQSALLQAMQEKIVTIAGQTYNLPSPFHVLATQNPAEQEGTYLLPEAQLDRFLFQIDIDYPDAQAEKDIILSTQTTNLNKNHSVTTPQTLSTIQNFVHQMPIGNNLLDVIVNMVRMCRPNQADSLDVVNTHVEWGPSPRAAQALSIGVRARALINGRPTPTLDDVEALMLPALKHRMSLKYSARVQSQSIYNIVNRAFEQSQYHIGLD